jgi:hypothetical protein
MKPSSNPSPGKVKIRMWWFRLVIPAILEAEIGRTRSEASQGKRRRPYLKSN